MEQRARRQGYARAIVCVALLGASMGAPAHADTDHAGPAQTDQTGHEQNDHGGHSHTGHGDHPQTGWSTGRPDGHAPIGVMADHVHHKGEMMFSYRYMNMYMEGNRDGTDSVGRQEVLDTFMITPTWMTMEMHMFGLMYAPTDRLTVSGMMPFVRKEMKHLTRTGVNFKTRSTGPGDFRLNGLYSLLERGWHRLHLNAGISFPTGSITERDSTPMGPKTLLPYPMRNGSGTFDLLPGATYLGQTPRWSWGAQTIGTVRLGENDHDYSLGDRVDATAWGARKWASWMSSSLRVRFDYWKNVDGHDKRLPPKGATVVPTARPDLRGGKRLDLMAGLNFQGTGKATGHRLAIEGGAPVWQDLDGPQLETDWIVTVGYQFSTH